MRNAKQQRAGAGAGAGADGVFFKHCVQKDNNTDHYIWRYDRQAEWRFPLPFACNTTGSLTWTSCMMVMSFFHDGLMPMTVRK